MVQYSTCTVSSSVHLPQTSTLLHAYTASSLPCSSFMPHRSVLIITLFTFPTASPYVHVLSDTMLQHPYDCPCKVLRRTLEHSTLDIQACSTTAHLRPAHLESPFIILPNPEPSTTSPASPPRVTHSRLHIHWPDYFHYWKLAISLFVACSTQCVWEQD